ncbi:MAG: glycosyltransferase family 2 protein [Actinomycetota bacterium]
MRLTVAILAQDEARMIERAVASGRFADEVLVIDGGSTDATVEIARLAGARVVGRPFDDFARQRNFALKQAHGDWVLFVDADERVTPALAREVLSLLAGSPDADAYAVPRESMALGRRLKWHPGGPDAPVRLMRRDAVRWVGLVHERIEGARRTGRLSAPLVHFTHRSVSEVVRKIDAYTEFQASELVARGAKPPAARTLVAAFPKAFVRLWRSGLRAEGGAGAVEAVLLAFNEALVVAKVWEKTRPEPLQETYRRADEELDLPEPRDDGTEEVQ